MKLIIRIIAIAALTYFISPFGSWWIAMVASFLICFVSPSSGLNAFIAGFLGVGLVWIGHSWNLDVQNESAFSTQIAEIMQLPDPLFLVIASGIVGGLAGGFSSLAGTYFRKLFVKTKQKSMYSS